MIPFSEFQKIDIRVGTIKDVQNFPEARTPAYILTIDLGQEIGIKTSSAQLPANYSKKDLIDIQVLYLVNTPPRKIGSFISEVLTLGLPDGKEHCILIKPERAVPNGGRLY